MNTLTDLPDLLGFHIGNPLGLAPLVMLIIILIVVAVMSELNHCIFSRAKAKKKKLAKK